MHIHFPFRWPNSNVTCYYNHFHLIADEDVDDDSTRVCGKIFWDFSFLHFDVEIIVIIFDLLISNNSQAIPISVRDL